MLSEIQDNQKIENLIMTKKKLYKDFHYNIICNWLSMFLKPFQMAKFELLITKIGLDIIYLPTN